MKYMSDFIDKHGHIAQGPPERDGGDSCSFAGQHFYAVYLQYKHRLISYLEFETEKSIYRSRMRNLDLRFGDFARHHVAPEWATERWVMSRDQSFANVCALGEAGEHWLLFKMLFFYILRLGFATNFYSNGENPKFKLPDFTGPRFYGMFIRSFRLYFLWPILVLTDLHLLLNSVVSLHRSNKDPKDASNITNHLISLLQSRDVMPTPISYLARKIQRKIKPVNENEFGPQSALDYFFNTRNPAEPPINESFRPVLEKLL